ncbi:hypothetical protein Q4567_04560 [Aliiglaciecola sp. 2_MG-2023]|uniref:hypothetical protein n=1 Tax=unclassified Aliiglaciecola TaxID=2593648 RepID=UPI0026E30B9B|nr:MULTISPECIES: hypothetical protein [unclassified Aliiglaciecola]MDO6709988.1 hypothetical protein [Aliiglaciecola sp. 2_MG-2023]MDO6751136.1 hypothetical protein [Aliiglaciecola sp. 1_MG-2023]
MSYYSLTPGSRVYLFEDGSGIGIYSGYDSNTFFINSRQLENVKKVELNLESTFDASLFQSILGLDQSEAEFVFHDLVEKKVLREVVEFDADS